MRALKKSAQSEVIGSDDFKQSTPTELACVINALLCIYQRVNKSIIPIKNLSGNRTSGNINLCAIDLARRLIEKPKHGGIHNAHCH